MQQRFVYWIVLLLVMWELPRQRLVAEDEAALPVKVAIPEVAEEKARQFASDLIASIESGKREGKLIDWAALFDRSARDLGANPKLISEFRKGFENTNRTSQGVFGQIEQIIKQGGAYRFIRVFRDAEGTRVKIRLTPSTGGVNFHDFLLVETQGKVRAVDFWVATSGEDFSEYLRRFVIPLVAQQDQGLLGKLLNRESALLKHLDEVQAMAEALREGRTADVAKIAAELPDEIRNEKFCLILEFTAAQSMNDTAAFEKIVDRFRQRYPADPAVDLLSVDYFLLKQDFAQSLECAERFQKSMGEEAYMQTKIADIHFQSGEIAKARAAIDQAIEREPDFLMARWTLVAIALRGEDYTSVRETLQTLITDFQIKIDPIALRAEPLYAEFVKSPDYEELATFIESR